jgi:transposase
LTAIHTNLGAIFVSLELSRSSWLITLLSPGGGEKMSKHSVPGGDFAGLMERFAQLQEKARLRTGSTLSDDCCTRGRPRRVLESPGAP